MVSGTDVGKALSGFSKKDATPSLYFARHLREFTGEKRGKVLKKYDANRQHM